MAISDWLVADSEDEDLFTELPPVNGPGMMKHAPVDDAGTSVIQTASDLPRTPQRGSHSPLLADDTSLFTPPLDMTDSTIANFTSAPLTSDTPSKVVPRPRPKPRVVIRKPATSVHDGGAADTSLSHISDPSMPTKQTTDSIHPATALSLGFSEATEDIYSSFGIADRAKMRSRNKTQTAKPIQQPYQTDEVIELTSDEDELTLKSTKRQKKAAKPKAPTKPRPKPTLRVKPNVALPDDLSSNETVDPYLQASSGQHASSPQYPASTLPTVPPTTPPQARELTPLSSPPITDRKRKRTRPSVAEDGEDELDVIACDSTMASAELAEPPLFFAPSSSSLPTDSGVEIPSVEPVGGRGKKKQASSKKGMRTRTQRKGKKDKAVRLATAVDETIEESTGVGQEPPAPAGYQSPGERHSSMAGNQTSMKKGKARMVDSDDELILLSKDMAPTSPANEEESHKSKENVRPTDLDRSEHTQTTSHIQARGPSAKSTPMSELIRRVNSQPNSPFHNVSRTYSPFLKSSRTMLGRIAPLHPNRRTPPPPLPRPPPPKKSKKQLEMEERIEEELEETVEGWSCLTDEERKALRKARIDAELGYE